MGAKSKGRYTNNCYQGSVAIPMPPFLFIRFKTIIIAYI